jgi:hypothetical protein
MKELNEIYKMKSIFPELEGKLNDVNTWFILHIDQLLSTINANYIEKVINNNDDKYFLSYK